MSILERNLSTTPELIVPRLELVRPYPLPADAYMANGIAVIGALDSERLDMIETRLISEFASMKQSELKKYGSCILYAIGVPYEDIMQIDKVVGDNTNTLTDGMTICETGNTSTLWRGQCTDRIFNLRKEINPIVFEDDSFETGYIYSLRSKLGLPTSLAD